MNNLVDSSVWIEYFRGNQKYSFLDQLINNNGICTNDIILAELLPSIIHKREYELAKLLRSVERTILTIDWQEIQNIQVLNLQHGNNTVGITDIIIAQNCLQNDLRLISSDRHFRVMAGYIPLKIYELDS